MISLFDLANYYHICYSIVIERLAISNRFVSSSILKWYKFMITQTKGDQFIRI